jgi:NAD-dependent DNA ligase
MINELKEKIKQANEAYRVGSPIMSDSEYDRLVEELSLLVPDDELLSKVGHEIGDESRKSRLPIEMGSMNKIKSMDDLDDWCRLKNISKSEIVVITPKYDGLSLCVNEFTNEAWTRGNGVFGQKSDSHYQYIGNQLEKNSLVQFTYGEVMMSKKTFIEKYSSEFANPRNLVAGLLNSKEVSEILKDTNFIKYGAVTTQEFSTKTEVLQFLNQNQSTKVPYVVSKISDLTEDFLISLFNEFSVEYEIDGLIIEIDNIRLQNQLGRETSSNNPVWARAFKHPSFEQSAETEITGITWTGLSYNGVRTFVLDDPNITSGTLDKVLYR